MHQLGLVFDMDGVIVDSTAAHTEAWRKYLSAHNIAIKGIEHRMLGKHNEDIVREFFAGSELCDDDVIRHGAEKEKVYRELIAPELRERLVPGVVDFLERHRNLPLALATNAEPANADFILDRAGIRPLFRVVVNGHQVKHPKPDPEIYLRTAEEMGLRAGDCVVFEDSITGVQAGRAAGMRVVGVTTTMKEFPNVDLTIGDFRSPALEPWLQEIALRG